MKILLSKKADSALNKKSDWPLRAFQMSDISLLAMSRTDQHLSRAKLTSDVLRPVRADASEAKTQRTKASQKEM